MYLSPWKQLILGEKIVENDSFPRKLYFDHQISTRVFHHAAEGFVEVFERRSSIGFDKPTCFLTFITVIYSVIQIKQFTFEQNKVNIESADFWLAQTLPVL